MRERLRTILDWKAKCYDCVELGMRRMRNEALHPSPFIMLLRTSFLDLINTDGASFKRSSGEHDYEK